MTKKICGYAVFETCGDYEQGLMLSGGPNMPNGGVLEWRSPNDPIAVFASRKAAREAITRTEHYRLAFNSVDHPEAKFCKITPITYIQ